jgi:RNA polymerase primary sigma factor
MRNLRIHKQITNRDAPSLNLYLQEISKLSLLTSEDETNLAHKIKGGDEKALAILITANLRFVVSVAKQYMNKGLTLSDLINEGNLGLIKAAERFDETMGFKFISYAVWWIRQSILQGLAENSRIIRLPLNRLGAISKVNRIFNKLEQEYQREPSAEEIAETMKFNIKVVNEAMLISSYPISTDSQLNASESDDFTLYDTLINSDSLSPDKFLLIKSLHIEIDRILAILDPRDAEILRYYFGLSVEYPLTIEEIGLKLKLTTERVRQLKGKALKKLHNLDKNGLLRTYLD